MATSEEKVYQQAERRLQRMLDRKIAAMKEENVRLERIEKNIKHLAKELGVELK
ncbi:MAG TPA: hypothetical protein VK694_00725 [Verrucomicrobiae bacterium]|nr:hypothetical protein [Verrucomicrobiae bacterium]